jgi:hypothetical protein
MILVLMHSERMDCALTCGVDCTLAYAQTDCAHARASRSYPLAIVVDGFRAWSARGV